MKALAKALGTCLQSLSNIQHYLDMMVSDVSYDPHVSTLNHINKLSDICTQTLGSREVTEAMGKGWEPELHPDLSGKIVISCDASIKNNPGGPASSGVVIRFVDASLKPYTMARVLPTAVTNNQAEYDAVYEALNYFRTFGPGPSCRSIEVRTDSKLVVNQVNGVWDVKDENLKHRHESVTEVLAEIRKKLEIPIEIVWYPRNSTDDLKLANYIAQDVLGVKNH